MSNPQPDMEKVHAAERKVGDRLEKKRQEGLAEERAVVTTPVNLAWSNVMADIRGLGKHETNNTPGARFQFRGIDAVMNAVGPVLRKHRVIVMPVNVESQHRDVTTSGGKPSTEVRLKVTYEITGPCGDTMIGMSVGESMDGGDKGTAQAMSVAYRVFLLQALTLPTDEKDPDATTHERGSAPTPAEKCAAGLPNVTDAGKLEELRVWAEGKHLLDQVVAGPQGPTPLSSLFNVHKARIEQQADKVASSTGGAK